MQPLSSKSRKTVLAFGDSITYGAFDISLGGWVNRLRLFLDGYRMEDPDFYVATYNLGIPGETTEGLLKRFKNEYVSRFNPEAENYFILAYGANDAAFIPSKNVHRVSVEEFADNLRMIITQIKEMGYPVFALNITPVVEEVAAHPLGLDKSRKNEYISSYNSTIKVLSEELKVPLIDVYSEFQTKDLKGLFVEDGLHPNDLGHEIIFNSVKEILLEHWGKKVK